MGLNECVWKDVVGYEGFYLVSSFGDVKALARKHLLNGKIRNTPEKIKKQTISKGRNRESGYYCVRLKNLNGISQTKMVHRLVAEAFIPNPQHYPTVNHIDGNKQNNNASNLEWCTYKDNNIHAVKSGLRPKTHRYLKEYTGCFICCEYCKKQIYRQKYAIKGNNFCSIGCYNNARKEKKYVQLQKIKPTTIRGGRLMVFMREHPFANGEGRVSNSRLVAEKFLLTNENSVEIDGKKYLKPEYKVFHRDRNRLNDNCNNLIVCLNGELCRYINKYIN